VPTSKKFTQGGHTIPSYRGSATNRINAQAGPEKKSWAAPKTDVKSVSGASGAASLTANEQWAFYSGKKGLKLKSRGYGIQSLKQALPLDGVGFAVFRISAENVGNTGKGIITDANIILQWKGPNSKTMDKVKLNGTLQTALNKLKPNKGFIEVLGLKNLSTENIFDRWRPGSGSKTIQD
jgi:hypothetical protein